MFVLSCWLEENIWSAEKKGNGEGRRRKYLEKNDILICEGEGERKYQLIFLINGELQFATA